MEKTRLIAAASMLAIAIFIACADGSPTDVGSVTSHDGGGLPIACAQWTCSAAACGYNTTYPAWACCETNIYQGPGGEDQPLQAIPGYQCGLGNSGGSYDDNPECNVVDNKEGGCYGLNSCFPVTGQACPNWCDDDSPCKKDDTDWANICWNSPSCQNQ